MIICSSFKMTKYIMTKNANKFINLFIIMWLPLKIFVTCPVEYVQNNHLTLVRQIYIYIFIFSIHVRHKFLIP